MSTHISARTPTHMSARVSAPCLRASKHACAQARTHVAFSSGARGLQSRIPHYFTRGHYSQDFRLEPLLAATCRGIANAKRMKVSDYATDLGSEVGALPRFHRPCAAPGDAGTGAAVNTPIKPNHTCAAPTHQRTQAPLAPLVSQHGPCICRSVGAHIYTHVYMCMPIYTCPHTCLCVCADMLSRSQHSPSPIHQCLGKHHLYTRLYIRRYKCP